MPCTGHKWSNSRTGARKSLYGHLFAEADAARSARAERRKPPATHNGFLFSVTTRERRTAVEPQLRWSEVMLQAIQDDDADQAAKALSMPGAAIDERIYTTPFHQVHYGGSLFRLALFPFGWDKRLSRSDGDTALHMSVKNGKFTVAQLLLAHGASADIKNSEGRTVEQTEAGFRRQAVIDAEKGQQLQSLYPLKSSFQPIVLQNQPRIDFQKKLPTHQRDLRARFPWMNVEMSIHPGHSLRSIGFRQIIDNQRLRVRSAA